MPSGGSRAEVTLMRQAEAAFLASQPVSQPPSLLAYRLFNQPQVSINFGTLDPNSTSGWLAGWLANFTLKRGSDLLD